MEFCMVGLVLGSVVMFLMTIESTDTPLNKVIGIMLVVLERTFINPLVKHMLHAFCPALVQVMDLKSMAEKGDMHPCSRQKLAFS